MTRRTPWDRFALVVHRSRAAWKSVTGSLKRPLDTVRGADVLLTYHRVLPDAADASAIHPGMYVRASTFELHLKVLQSRWELATLSSILDPPRDDRPRVALTFDDGWRDNLEVAWPILQRHGATGTIFLATGSCEAGRNEEGAFMRPDEIRGLPEAGMEFGAHTIYHSALDVVAPTVACMEMEGSKHTVARWTGRPCRVFAYPYGRRTPQVERIASELFDASVLAEGGWWRRGGDPARIPRIGIHDDMAFTRALFEERLVEGLGGQR